MRFALWTVAIVGAAVGVALLLRQSEGYVVIVSAPWRVELSLAVLVACVLAGYLAFHSLMRLGAWIVRIPARVRVRRAERARDASRKALNEALLAFFQGRYASAERSAASAMADAESRGVAAIVAARSAHELGRFAEREAFLGQATGAAAVDEARLTTLADLLIAQGKHDEALTVVGELLEADPRNTRALRLRLEAERGLARWAAALASIEALHKAGALGASEAEGLREEAQLRHLESLAGDGAALAEAWRSLPLTSRVAPRFALAGARLHLASRDHGGAQAIVEAALEQAWDPALVALYADCAGDDALPLIERAEAWLPNQARDAVLLLTLGKLCTRQSLWGKAQGYLEASLATQPTPAGHRALADLLDQLGKSQEAGRHRRKSAELAG